MAKGAKMFCESKAAQMAACLLHRANGRMPHLKLMKLMYLADRFCFEDYDRSMSKDNVVSMDYGPVFSKTYDLMKGKVKSGAWSGYVSPIDGNEISLAKEVGLPQLGKLSRADVKALDEVYRRYGRMNEFDLSEFTHRFPEWRDPSGSSVPVPVRAILQAVGKEPEVIEQIVEEMEESDKLEMALAAP